MGLSSVAVAVATGYLTETVAGGTLPLQRFPLSGTGDSSSRTIAVTSTSNATPIVVTTGVPHLLGQRQRVTLSGVTGNTNANGTWKIVVLSATTFALYDAITDLAAVGNGSHGGSPVLTDPACLVDAGSAFTNYLGYMLEITGGTGAGQVRRIIGVPTATTVSVERDWDVQPDATSTWVVWVKRGPIFIKSYSFYAGSAAMGNCGIADGQGGEVLIQLGPAAGLAANGTLNWAAQTSMGIPFMVGPYLTLVGTGAFLSYEFERA
jgi:hypothetical protein